MALGFGAIIGIALVAAMLLFASPIFLAVLTHGKTLMIVIGILLIWYVFMRGKR